MKTLIGLAFCGALLAQAPAVKPEDLCTVEGIVRDRATGAPLADVKLRLRPASSEQATALARAQQTSFVTMTGETGRFAFAGIEPGSYEFRAERTGFITAAYGAKGPRAAAPPFRLTAGQKAAGIEFRMIPQGAIAGRVLGADGEPVTDTFFTLSLLRPQYVNGRRQLARAAFQGSVRPDDRGDYRLYGLAPGQYYLSASVLQFPGAKAQVRPAKAPESYVATYYPGTTDARSAVAIEVRAGATTSGIDLRLAPARTYSVRGRVINQTGTPLDRLETALSFPGGTGGTTLISSSSLADAPRDFQFQDVTLGAVVTIGAGGVNPQRRTLYARRDVTVNEDISNLDLAIRPGFAVAGVLRVESGQAPRGVQVALNQKVPAPSIQWVPKTVVGEDGAFIFEDVNADDYFVAVTGMPGGFYVKSIRLGQQNLLESGIELAETPEQKLEIVLSPKAGMIEGSVVGAGEGIVAALVPANEKLRSRPEYYRSAVTDNAGKFRMASLPPGEYAIYVWEEAEEGAWMDPEFLKKSKGTAVTVLEGGVETLDLQL